LRALYTPRRLPLIQSIGLGMGLGVLALSLATLTKIIVIKIVGNWEPQQRMVQAFDTAISSGDQGLIWTIAASAVIVAPICEEVLFRGSLYPMLARVMGRGVSALVVSGIFAMAHDTLTDAPSLAALALCFTIGYEYSGSLLVSIFMHATFNGINLLQQWMVTGGVG
jgi:membrane protease YdiL (CAAX protease family)